MRGAGLPMPPQTLIYRFYELVMVNGPAWKALIEENSRRYQFGDRFDLQMERLPNLKGDRVKITCRENSAVQYYGNSGNIRSTGKGGIIDLARRLVRPPSFGLLVPFTQSCRALKG